jgi:hypothetical protein
MQWRGVNGLPVCALIVQMMRMLLRAAAGEGAHPSGQWLYTKHRRSPRPQEAPSKQVQFTIKFPGRMNNMNVLLTPLLLFSCAHQRSAVKGCLECLDNLHWSKESRTMLSINEAIV